MKIELNPEELRPLVEAIVAETVQAISPIDNSPLGPRLAYLEHEAADLLGVRRHTLRDIRLRGGITSTRVGGRVAYTRESLIAY